MPRQVKTCPSLSDRFIQVAAPVTTRDLHGKRMEMEIKERDRKGTNFLGFIRNGMEWNEIFFQN